MTPHAFSLCAQDSEFNSTAVPSHHRPTLASLLKETYKPLRNEIHDMFAIQKWASKPTPQQFLSLLPALQIATHLLNQTRVLKFFAHILYADITISPGKVYLAGNSTSTQPLAHLAVHQTFTDLAHKENLRFGFHACEIANEARHAHGMAFSSTQSYTDYCHYGRPTIRQFNNPRIVLNVNYPLMLERLTRLATSKSDIQVIQLCIATTLIHELAHIVWTLRAGGDLIRTSDGAWRCAEPSYSLADTRGDLGFALEDIIFGGVVEPQDHGNHIIPWASGGKVPCGDSLAWSRVVVPRWWVYMWFNETLYERDVFDKLHQAGELVVPKRWESQWEFQYVDTRGKWRLLVKGKREGELFAWRDVNSFLQSVEWRDGIRGVGMMLFQLTLDSQRIQDLEAGKIRVKVGGRV